MALRGETSIAELCRREGVNAESMYYSWSKDFLEAGKRKRSSPSDTARAATTDEVKQLRREAQDSKEVVAEQALELRLLKSMIGDGGERTWRLPASEKLEIIRLVEQSHLPARRTLKMLRYQAIDVSIAGMIGTDPGGREALEDKPSKPDRVWNRILLIFASALL